MSSFSRALLLMAGVWGGLGVCANSAQAATATSALPGLICRHYPAATLEALRQGRSRLVVVVQAFTPAGEGKGALVVWQVPGNAQADIELARVAVYPPQPYGLDDRSRWQRYLLTLAPGVELAAEGAPLCLRVGFDPAGASEGQGRLVFELEVKVQ